MNTNREKEPQNKNRNGKSDFNENEAMDTRNSRSLLTDKEDDVEHTGDDQRPVKNATQEGYGMDDGPNQPLSKEMLNDLQDAGQRDLQRQREEEKKQNKDA